MPKSISKNTFHHVFILIQPGNQAVFTPLQAGLNSDLKKYHSFFFMTVANTNHWQMIPQNNTYDPNKYHIYREWPSPSPHPHKTHILNRHVKYSEVRVMFNFNGNFNAQMADSYFLLAFIDQESSHIVWWFLSVRVYKPASESRAWNPCLRDIISRNDTVPSSNLKIKIKPPHDETNKMACAPSEDSDKPGHLPSLIRVFAVSMKKTWVLSYPLSAQRWPWSDWVDAQADRSLR